MACPLLMGRIIRQELVCRGARDGGIHRRGAGAADGFGQFLVGGVVRPGGDSAFFVLFAGEVVVGHRRFDIGICCR